MDLKPLSFLSNLEEYQKQAEELLDGHGSGDTEAIRVFHQNHPRFLDSEILWLPKNLPDSEIQSAGLELADAQLALARWYSFQSWAAVEAVVTGELAAWKSGTGASAFDEDHAL
jgi:hypothetical protein